jgi:glycosyltransferase involved in cell wall biosynthesis
VKISVLLPTKNRLQYLKYAIESVLRQDYTDWEIIVSDNCSEEDVAGFVRDLNDKRVVYLRTPSPVPVTDNWNNAIDHATGDYIVMLGDDDGLLDGYMSKAATLIQQHDAPDLLFFSALIYAYPGVFSEHPDGFFQELPHSMFRGICTEVLSHETRSMIVAKSLNFQMGIAFNMQYSLMSAALVAKLRKKGNVFKSPYPDFYATNAMFLLADRVLLYNKPMVVIGVTPRSYGYFHFNNKEQLGMEFLGDDLSSQTLKGFQNTALPGNRYLTSWLAAMEVLSESFPGQLPARVNRRKYRNMQIAASCRDSCFRSGIGGHGIATIIPFLSKSERIFCVPFYVCGFLFIRLLPGRLRDWLIATLARLAVGQSAVLGRESQAAPGKTLIDLVKGIGPQT